MPRASTAATPTLLDAQRTLLETTQLLGLKGVEASMRLMDLNTRALRDWRSGSSAGGADAGALPTPDLTAFASYLQELGSLCLTTGSEVTQLLQRQAEGLQALVGALATSGWSLPGLPAREAA